MKKIKKIDDFIAEKYGMELIDGTYYCNGVEINEMAYERQDFLLYLRCHLTTIAAHYVMLKYASEHSGYEQLVPHWRGELETRIVDVQEMETKPKANNRSMVKRALEQEWDKSDCNNNPQKIIRKITPKLNEECIVIEKSDLMKYVESFITDVPSIIELMSNTNNIQIKPLLDKICPTEMNNL